MDRDIRGTDLFEEIEAFCAAVRRPGSCQISDAAELHVSADGTKAVFAGTIMEKLEGAPVTRICLTDLATGATRALTSGPNTDRLPRFSPDGRSIAFLSDREQEGDFRLYLLDPVSAAIRSTPSVAGWIEYLQWASDGERILLGAAGHGADVAGGQGAIASKKVTASAPAWTPTVDGADETFRWRSLWIYDLSSDRIQQVSAASINVWEGAWCGPDEVVAVVSPAPGEGAWYTARLSVLNIHTGESRDLYTPQDQIGWPAVSPSGHEIAIVDALCSDRWIVAGELCVIQCASGHLQRIDMRGADITYTEWVSDQKLLVAGHRRFETVVGVYDSPSQSYTELWSSTEITTGGRYTSVAALGTSGDCALIGESFARAPELALIRAGKYQPVRSFDLGYSEQARVIGAIERITWQAPDRLEIDGWLLLPRESGARRAPWPLVMYIHGGPVWHWRNSWLGRGASAVMLIKHGYAVFFPNPRGSSGRGREFARHVLGEMGGADTYDFLSGIDHLVRIGMADPARLGVTGGSYGGFMTCWLISQDPRFAAAVALAPVTNHLTQQLIGNIPQFVSLFLKDSYTDPQGKYFRRSPIMFVHQVKTPTLNICGGLDRCTPPEEAIQFHNALLEQCTESVLVIYPEEGHGVRKFPAAIDYTARVVAWFEEHMPSATADSGS